MSGLPCATCGTPTRTIDGLDESGAWCHACGSIRNLSNGLTVIPAWNDPLSLQGLYRKIRADRKTIAEVLDRIAQATGQRSGLLVLRGESVVEIVEKLRGVLGELPGEGVVSIEELREKAGPIEDEEDPLGSIEDPGSHVSSPGLRNLLKEFNEERAQRARKPRSADELI